MMAFLKWVILVPLAVIAIGFAFANHGVVTVSFDPVSNPPAFALSAPLFVVMILAVIAGVLLGGIATWIGQRRHRRAARAARREIEDLRSETARLRRELDVASRDQAAGPGRYAVLTSQNAA